MGSRAPIALLAVAVLAAPAGPSAGTVAAAGSEASRCPPEAAKAPRGRIAREFFPGGRLGLWSPGDTACVWRLTSGSWQLRPVWRAPRGARVRGLQWAPDGRSFVAVATPGPRAWRVYHVSRAGHLLGSFAATGAAFLRDGRLVLSRRHGLFLVAGRRARPLAPRAALDRAAGFHGRTRIVLGEDVWAYARGAGSGRVALVWLGQSRSTLLVVPATGSVERASPVYSGTPDSARRGAGSIGGFAWTPRGNRLLEFPAVRSPPGFGYDHDHCLDTWSPTGGYKRVFCISRLPPPYRFHFDKLAWGRTRQRGVLDDGTVVDTRGRVAGHVDVHQAGGAFAVHWAPDPAS